MGGIEVAWIDDYGIFFFAMARLRRGKGGSRQQHERYKKYT